MKKPLYLALLLCLTTSAAFAQLENKGWWTRDLFTYSYYHQNDAGAVPRTYNRYFTQPEVGYVLNKHWMAGLVFQYEFIRDRYDLPANANALQSSTKNFYGAGPLLRYYLPLSKRASFMPEVFSFWSKQTDEQVYVDPSGERKVRNTKHQFGIGANPTIVYFITRDLAFSITVVNIGYYASRTEKSFTLSINPQQWLFGVEYYFEKKKARQGKTEIK